MSAAQTGGDRRRFRLATNDNETIVVDELDTEGHRLATNDNETVVDGAAQDEPDADEESGASDGQRPAR